MPEQLTLRDVIIKLGLKLDGTQQSAMNPLWDYKLVLEDPVSEPRDSFKCDGVFLGENVIHLHMGDQLNI